ncbi:MAG: phosphatase PAP2 family protein, partial [Verrucomicrobiota bacterium]
CKFRMNQSRAFWKWLCLAICAALLIGVAFYFDGPVQSWITQHQNRTAKIFMRNVSRFGDWPEHVAIGLALFGVAWWRGSKKWTRIFVAMLLAMALAGVAARGVKIASGRARPSVKQELGWNGPRLSSKYHAFPSGHTAASTAFFATLFFVSWRLGLACLPIPLLIAASRMYVAAHYLSDVVCAALLGIVCAILITRWLFKTKNRHAMIRDG